MKYRSTRSNYETNSLNAVINGIAPDGGLYVCPEIIASSFDWKKCLEYSTKEMEVSVLSYLMPEFDDMKELVRKAYTGKFETEELVPLVEVGNRYVLELFRGPTSAFKDVALSMLPHLITSARKKLGITEDTIILTATSGDTGKAALEGFKDVEGTKIIVFYPKGGVSPIQKAQMTTQEGNNVKVCAVRGNFDDCQTGVKKAFASLSDYSLSSANSINIGRLAPQIVYYFSSYRDLVKKGRIKVGEKVDYVVPTGNFGDILAGLYAKYLGLPVGKLVCASNVNNVLFDFFETGVYNKNRAFERTNSPSMDILVSSNLERLLYFASGFDSNVVSSMMKALSERGSYDFSPYMDKIREVFAWGWCSEQECLKTISECWKNNGYLCDPHTAVAWKFASEYRSSNPVVVLSTASPYKFPKAVLSALGESIPADEFEMIDKINALTGVKIPKNLSALQGKTEIHKDVIDIDEITEYIKGEVERWK